MAIKMSAAELTTFKHNLDLMSPYHDQRLLDRLAKYLYSSSEYNYTIVKGLEQAVVINQIQMYSRHQREYECKTLCSHIPLKKLYQAQNLGQKYIDQVEFMLYPKRKAIREQNRQQQTTLAEENEQKLTALQSLPPPKRVDTSSFPKVAQKLNIYCAADTAFIDRTPPITITIYGLAAAHVVEYIHSLYPEIDINVVIINPAITAIMLCLDPDMGARLSNAHTHLFLGNDNTPILHDAIIIPPEIHLAPEVNSNLKLRLIFAGERNYNKLLGAKRRRGLNAVLAQYNFPYTKLAPQLQKDTFNHCENIALIFPGPSLVDTYDRLKELKKNGVRLIACDSALPALEQLKIAPDIIVAADIGVFMYAGPYTPNIFIRETAPRIFMNPKFYAKSTMIFTSKTHLLLLALFPSKKYILYTKDMQRRDIPMTPNALVNMDITGSSSTLMFDLAVQQGAQKIYLFGLDTVTRLESFHAGFNSDDDKNLINPNSSFDDVPCNDGNMRRALHYFTETRFYIEKKIAAYKWINVINCSPYGCVIKGARLDDTDSHSLFIAHNVRKSDSSHDKQHGKNAKSNKQSLGKSSNPIMGLHDSHSGDSENATNEALLIAREASMAIRALIDGSYSSGNNGAGDATYSGLTRNNAPTLSHISADGTGGKALNKQRSKVIKSKSGKHSKSNSIDQLNSLLGYDDEQSARDAEQFTAEDSSDYDTFDREDSDQYYTSVNRYSSRNDDYNGEDDYGDGNSD